VRDRITWPMVGFERTTLGLTAVKPADSPAAIGCYKLLSFVHFAQSLLPVTADAKIHFMLNEKSPTLRR